MRIIAFLWLVDANLCRQTHCSIQCCRLQLIDAHGIVISGMGSGSASTAYPLGPKLRKYKKAQQKASINMRLQLDLTLLFTNLYIITV